MDVFVKSLLTMFDLAVGTLAGVQEEKEPGELPILEEIDRQLFKSPFFK